MHVSLVNENKFLLNASVIRSCNRCYDRLILEAIVINKHKDNINRETATLSTTWYPLLTDLTVHGLSLIHI